VASPESISPSIQVAEWIPGSRYRAPRNDGVEGTDGACIVIASAAKQSRVLIGWIASSFHSSQ
jgi:hypothetical protein